MSRIVWRVLAPLALLLGLGIVVDAGTVVGLLAAADLRWVLTGLLIVQCQIVLSALRWQLTARRLGQTFSTPQVVSEYYIASLLNQILPGGVSGDAARIIRNRTVAGTAAVARGVVIERLAGQVALLVVTLTGLLFWPWLTGVPVPDSGYLLVITALLIMGAAFVVVWFAGRALSGRVGAWLQSMGPALRQAWVHQGAWRRQGALSLVIVGSYLLVFAISALALSAPLSLAAAITVVPLALLTMLVPISVGGWGVREAAAAALWPLVGLSAESGIATSIAYGLISLAGSAPGLVLIGLARR